jgi:hypothetical protein
LGLAGNVTIADLTRRVSHQLEAGRYLLVDLRRLFARRVHRERIRRGVDGLLDVERNVTVNSSRRDLNLQVGEEIDSHLIPGVLRAIDTD